MGLVTDVHARSDLHHRSDVVDLRDGASQPPVVPEAPRPPVPPEASPQQAPEGSQFEHGASAPQPAVDLPEPDPPPPTGPDPRSSLGRRAVIAVVGGVVAFALLVVFLLPAFARVRQTHRADEYTQADPRLTSGDPAFALQIPAIGFNEVVVTGATPELLRGGPGWREGSATPGQGNTVVLGHSTLWGYSFGRLKDLTSGSLVYARMRDGRVYVYKVTSVKEVDGDDTDVLDPTGPSRMTLVTSAGGPFDSRRVVVQAAKDGTQPAVPDDQRVRLVKGDQGGFDGRGAGGLVLLVGGAAVAALGVFGAVELRRRTSLVTTVVVAGPAVALGVGLVLFHLDSFLPMTY
ncbi:sortase [Dermatobacter hominis]|uniref:sortase n=1 Tax=Dermatobacter hominis TaxID=2884263 RepID=UPI001D121350|nr:sortase [Dermatobacter hominis]UDY37920.1 sortase [Dermatobacter hominis]